MAQLHLQYRDDFPLLRDSDVIYFDNAATSQRPRSVLAEQEHREPEKEEDTDDARPSDAIALAVRFNCPISAYEQVMEEAGIVMDELGDMEAPKEPEEPEIPEVDDSIDNLSVKQLQKLLQIAIDEENYEKAAEIRDLIKEKS